MFEALFEPDGDGVARVYDRAKVDAHMSKIKPFDLHGINRKRNAIVSERWSLVSDD